MAHSLFAVGNEMYIAVWLLGACALAYLLNVASLLFAKAGF